MDTWRNRRKTAACINCGQIREIAAHQLCFRCYRQAERDEATEANSAPVDRHTGAIQREHRRLFRAFSQLMQSLADLNINGKHILQIRSILSPYLQPIAVYLEGQGSDDKGNQRPDTTSVNVNNRLVHVHTQEKSGM